MRALWRRMRWLFGGGRGPVAPGPLARGALWAALVAVAAGAAWAHSWIHRAEEPARTLVLASRAA
ncbi:MAG TPA: hypothetical protein VMK65_09685, partial [Longimicrobiales bacterium]|nr:hypothetical protein [Longimicrobiales bacterium]